MNQMNIVLLFKKHLWKELVHSYLAKEIVKVLSFKEGLVLAYQLLYYDSWDEDLQEYEIRKNY